MADSRLNITVTSDDRSIDAVNAKIKELTKQYKALSETARKNRPELAAEIDQWKNYRTQALEPIVGAQGKMMQSYFKTGEELRRFYREQRVGDKTMRESTQAITGFASMLGGSGSGLGAVVGGVASRFQEAEFAMTGLGIAAQGAGGKLAGIGTVLMANAGPIAAAVAAIAGIVWVMTEAKKATAEFDTAAKGLNESLISMGRVGKDAQVAMLTKQITAIEKEKFTPSLSAGLRGQNAIAQEHATWVMNKEARINALIEKRDKIQSDQFSKRREERAHELEDMRVEAEYAQKRGEGSEQMIRYIKEALLFETDITKQYTLQEKLKETLERQRIREGGLGEDESEGFYAGIASGLGGKARKGLDKGAAARAKAAQRVSEAQDRARKLGEGPTGERAKSFGEVFDDLGGLESAFDSATSNMAGMVGSKIGNAFSQMFGGAQTALGSFAGAFMSTLSSMAMQVASAGILNTIFPGLGMMGGFAFKAAGGPVSGGRPYIVGERGPELFVPNRSGEIVSNAKMARFGGAMAAASGPVVMDVVLRGSDLVLVQAKARRGRGGRLM